MRITHVYKDYFPVCGGIENHIKVLAEHQAAAGHAVTVLAAGDGRRKHRETLNGVEVIKVPRLATLRSMPIAPAMIRTLRHTQGDLIHVHSPFPLGEAATLCMRGQTPIVATHHSDVVKQKLLLRVYAPIYRRFLKRVDRIIPTSPRYEATSPWLKDRGDQCRVVPLGIDADLFQPAHHAPPPEPLTLLFTGRSRYYKGVNDLITALAGLPSVRALIAGDGPEHAAWVRQSAQLGLSDRIDFLGHVPDEELPSLYHRAHCFVLPANCRAEAFGTVLLEAMASGLPCIATELGTGTSWVVEDGVTGLIIPSRSPDALRDAILKLKNERRLLDAYGLAARQRVEKHFTMDHMVAGVQAVYDELT